MEWGWFAKLDMIPDNVLGMNCMYSRLYYTHCVTMHNGKPNTEIIGR